MRKIKPDDMVSVQLTEKGREAWAIYSLKVNWRLDTLTGKLKAPLRDVMRIGTLYGCYPGAMFVDDEITIEGEPSPGKSARQQFPKALGGITTAEAIENWRRAWRNYEKGTEESMASRFRITTNGVKFRVEEWCPPPIGRSDEPWRWMHVGGPGQSIAIVMGWEGYDTMAKAVYAKAERIRAAEKTGRPWVPVEKGS